MFRYSFSGVIAALALVGISTPGLAVTIDAQATSTHIIDFRVNDGGLLPADIIAGPSGPISDLTIESALDAADANTARTEFVDIAGTSADDPSEFRITDLTSRDSTDDIASGSTVDFLYGVRVASPEPPSDFVEAGIRGIGLASGIIHSSDPLQANALVDVFRARDVTFENLTGDDFFFTLTGQLAAGAIAEFSGANGFAAFVASVALLFESTGVLDISLSALSPFLPVQSSTGDRAVSAITRVVDVAGTGMLGVTLRPGEVLTMRFSATYRDQISALALALALAPPAPAPLPAGGGLLLTALGALAQRGPRNRR